MNSDRSDIRVHAISPGPLKTRAASGIKDFELLLNEAANKAPLGELVDIMDVGWTCAYLATPFARRTGGTSMSTAAPTSWPDGRVRHDDLIAVINAGSSSIKFALYEARGTSSAFFADRSRGLASRRVLIADDKVRRR